MIALLSNLSGAGTVLIISGTGGSAVNVTGDFLSDQKSVAPPLTAAAGEGRPVPVLRSLAENQQPEQYAARSLDRDLPPTS